MELSMGMSSDFDKAVGYPNAWLVQLAGVVVFDFCVAVNTIEPHPQMKCS